MENIIIEFANASNLRVALAEMTQFALFMAKEFSEHNDRVNHIYKILENNNIQVEVEEEN